MEENKIILHVGRPRTATNWLQKAVFPHFEGLSYVAKRTEAYYPSEEWLLRWHYLDDYKFNKQKVIIVQELRKRLDKNKVNLLSSTAFSQFGGAWYTQALRCKAVVPNAKIMIVFRDPLESLLSYYKRLIIHDCLYSSLCDSIDFTDTPLAFYRRKCIYINDYFYNDIVQHYCELFGKEKVGIFKYENLKDSCVAYLDSVRNFMGIPKVDLSRIDKKPINSHSQVTWEEIDELRKKNLTKHLEGLLGCQADFSIKPQSEEQIENISAKIISSLRGKCLGYY